jgi:hypothetical protein
MLIIGFMGADRMIGLTSFCCFWGLGDPAYLAFRGFFRCSVWPLNTLISKWAAFVLAQNETVMAQGRAVLLGDHTYVPKDGQRMPGVVTLHQDSETQTKPSYFRGHCWGATGLMVGSLFAPFCLPLALRIHQGFIHIRQQNKAEGKAQTMGPRIVEMAIQFAIKHDLPSVLILDAFFPECRRIQASRFCLVHQT